MNYKTIDKKIVPSIDNNGELITIMIKALREDNGSIASSFSVATSEDKKLFSVMHVKDGVLSTDTTIDLINGGMVSEKISASVDLITEGMKEVNSEKVRKAIFASAGVCNTMTQVFDSVWEEEEKELLFSAAKNISEEFDKLKLVETVGSASNDKLSHYAFRKHLLIQGEKGGLDLLATIAA